MDRGSGRRGGYNNAGGANGNQFYQHQHYRREFHASQRSNSHHNLDLNNNNNSLLTPVQVQVSSWRNLVKRYNELNLERCKALRELDTRQFVTEKSLHPDTTEETKKEKNKAKFNKNKGENLNLTRQDKFGKVVEQKELTSSSNNNNTLNDSKLGKDKIMKSNQDSEVKLSKKEKQHNKEIMEEKESYETQRAALIEKFNARERKLESDIQCFFLEMDRQLVKLNHRLTFDPVLTRNKILENELIRRDQREQHLQHHILELEERNRAIMEQMQQMSAEFNFEKMQMRQEFENEQSIILSKVKCEAVTEFLEGDRWHVPNNNTNNNNGSLGAQQSQEQQLRFQSPALQLWRKSPEGNGILTDLRDREEDLQVKATMGDREKLIWTATMIRKIVTFYESQGIRVYEESMANQYISTLMWCSDENLCPNKHEVTLAIGHGDTVEDATENSVQIVYSYIQGVENETMDNHNVDYTEESSTQLPHEAESSSPPNPESSISASSLNNSFQKDNQRIQMDTIERQGHSNGKSVQALSCSSISNELDDIEEAVENTSIRTED